MRYLILSSILLLSMSFFTLSSAPLTGCEAKKNGVQQQIEYAREQGNTHRIAGLEKALSEINENCKDHSLQRMHQRKVLEKQRKVEEREQELNQAKEIGNPKKIAKKQEKLSVALNELKKAQAELSQ